MLESKERIEKLYKEIGNSTISDLYMYSCLLSSGFDKDTSYKLIPTLTDLWLKDENNCCISTLSDMLFDVYDQVNLDKISTRELLIVMYNYYY